MMDTRLESLQGRVESAARAALAEIKIPCAITSTLRTTEEQSALYAQGREMFAAVNRKRVDAGMRPLVQYQGKDGKLHSDNDWTVTSCDGIRISDGGHGRSPHQLGIALDVVPTKAGQPEWPPLDDPRWIYIAEAFERHGFEWGGRWTAPYEPDFPHHQFRATV